MPGSVSPPYFRQDRLRMPQSLILSAVMDPINSCCSKLAKLLCCLSRQCFQSDICNISGSTGAFENEKAKHRDDLCTCMLIPVYTYRHMNPKISRWKYVKWFSTTFKDNENEFDPSALTACTEVSFTEREPIHW